MTVTNTTSKITVNGDGVATTFSFSPMVLTAATDLLVILIDVGGTQITKVLNVDYTVNIAANGYPATGTITYPISGSPLASTQSLVMKRVLPLTQLTDLENQGGYFADVQESALDKLTMILIQQQEILDRAIRLVITTQQTVSTELPEPSAGAFIGWNSTATGLTNLTSLVGPTGPQGPQGPAGAGTGDMLKSENLSGLSNYTTARSNLGVYSTAQTDTAITTALGHSAPTGCMMMWGTTSAPTGWLFCDGSAVDRTAYALLFGVIGTTFGAGDGSTTFNVPDLRGRLPMGVGQGNTADGGGVGTNRTLATKTGAEGHTLTTSEIPLHGHPFRASYTNATTARSATTGGLMTWTGGVSSQTAYTGAVSNNQGQQIGGTGGGASHNVVNPVLVLEFIIKTGL